jgi:glucose dehydrogenase
MKEYDETKYFLMNRKASTIHGWCAYITRMVGVLALAVGVLLILLWAVLQVGLMFKELI